MLHEFTLIKLTRATVMPDWDVIVIGSGAGGLSAAVALSNLGQKVLVLEQHYLPGGWTHTFALDGHKFSPGVHYIGQLNRDGRTRKLLEGLGVAVDIEFLELNPDGYDHIVFQDETFDIPRGREKFIHRLVERFPDERQGIERYFALMQRVDQGLSRAGKAKGLWGGIKLLFSASDLLLRGMKPASQIIDRYVSDHKLKAILEARSGDHGMTPARAPFALHVAIESHYWDGAWFPKGGGGAIPKALISRLRKNGGEIRVRSRVEQILIEGTGLNRRAVGVKLECCEEIRAKAIVSNADAWVTYERLVGLDKVSEKLAGKVKRLVPSVSALSLYIATDIDVDALGLDSGNYWILNNPDVDATYAVADQDCLHESGPFPGAFLTVTTKKDPSKMHNGLHTMEAFTFVPFAAFERWQASESGKRPEDYTSAKENLTNRMLDTIAGVVPGLRDHLVLCELGTPLTNLHYVNAYRGCLYGTAKSKTQIGPRALPIKTEIDGLFHCGQSTSAHGVLGALVTGAMAASQITGKGMREILVCDDNGKAQLHPAA